MCDFNNLVLIVDNLKKQLVNISNGELINNLDNIDNLEIKIDDLNLELNNFKDKLKNIQINEPFANLSSVPYSINLSSEANLNNLSLEPYSNNLRIEPNSNNSPIEQNSESIFILSEENLIKLKNQSTNNLNKLIIDADNLNQLSSSNQSENNLNQLNSLDQSDSYLNQFNRSNKSENNLNQLYSSDQSDSYLNQPDSSNQPDDYLNQSDNSNKSSNHENNDQIFNLFGNLSPLTSSSDDDTFDLEKNKSLFSNLEDFFGYHSDSTIFNLNYLNDNQQFNNEQLNNEKSNNEKSNNEKSTNEQLNNEKLNNEKSNNEKSNKEKSKNEKSKNEKSNDEKFNDEQFELNKCKQFKIELTRLPDCLLNLAANGKLNINNPILKQFLNNDNAKDDNEERSDSLEFDSDSDDEIIAKTDTKKRKYFEIYSSDSESEDTSIKTHQSNNSTSNYHQSRFYEYFSRNRTKHLSKLEKFKNYSKINYHKFLDNKKIRSILNSK